MSERQFTAEELVKLGAADPLFFCKAFFPQTVRQDSPPFHKEIWRLLDSPEARLVNIQVFRGGAKTSILRMYTARRIAYGISHTILYVGKSEGHAVRSIKWLRRAVEFNRQFRTVFGVKPGSKWQDTEAEIIHQAAGHSIWVLGMGITGSVRGINLDDYRPDLIVVDDVIDEENSATEEQRKKTEALIHGALVESLAPASEAPYAKLVMLQTPLHREDASMVALHDPMWKSAVFGCWTKETENLLLDQRESIWPDRWPSEVLREERRAAMALNRLSIWVREKECKLIAPETSAFKLEWLKHYDLEPEDGTTVIAIDPVPPPSDVQIAKGLKGKDYEVLMVVRYFDGNFYVLDYEMKRGHDPGWTIATFFHLAQKYRPRKVFIEAVAYQRTLAWLLREEMEKQRQYYVIEEVVDRRKKYDRILDALTGIAAEGHLYVRGNMADLKSQWAEYPDCAHDDLLDALSCAIVGLRKMPVLSYEDLEEEEEREYPPLEYERPCP